ncbi:uncharacterized protein GGS25DRAFT_486772 [Hypoxylon fragiforme]|uniref:uncharacterized protein n=1 Tax=Hypoxylon fragiforme TaxID=63214 RepID=UPI0020C65CA9|nr:uncharacterized protein GGS25DRAFT_486772 [Hypoxylon fragiforme]KAI2609917.1 hypothetical protein GGS25DRAFT_486772 [Hypoxylon fragiforme]
MPPALDLSSDDDHSIDHSRVTSDLIGVDTVQEQAMPPRTPTTRVSKGPGRPRKRAISDVDAPLSATLATKLAVTAKDDVVMEDVQAPPRKRGRPRKSTSTTQPGNGVGPASSERDPESRPQSSASNLSRNQDGHLPQLALSNLAVGSPKPTGKGKHKRTPKTRGNQPNLESLLREIFILNTVQQGQELRITHEQAMQLHSIFAPALSAPEGELMVPSRLANAIRSFLANPANEDGIAL